MKRHKVVEIVIYVICSLYFHVGIGLYFYYNTKFTYESLFGVQVQRSVNRWRCSVTFGECVDRLFFKGGLFCMTNVFWLFMNDKIISQKPLQYLLLNSLSQSTCQCKTFVCYIFYLKLIASPQKRLEF